MMSDIINHDKGRDAVHDKFQRVLLGGINDGMDGQVAGIAAKRFAGPEVTTAEGMKFLRPHSSGAFIEVAGCYGSGNTSRG